MNSSKMKAKAIKWHQLNNDSCKLLKEIESVADQGYFSIAFGKLPQFDCEYLQSLGYIVKETKRQVVVSWL